MRQILLGQAPLGQGGAVGSKPRQIGPPYYLINDAFTTDLAAGSVNGTDAEPGPGRRLTVNANAKLSITGGKAVFAAGGAVGDPRLLYSSFIPGLGGRLCILGITYTAGGFDVGVDNDTISGVYDGIRASGSGLSCRLAGVVLSVGTVATGNTYQLAVVERSAGSFIFIKGGAFTNWTMLYISITGGGAFSPAAQAINSSSSFSIDNVIVPATPWLPTPLASDGFSAWGTTDGLGHAEGVTGGIGAGGNGEVWTDNVGTWGASGGAAAASALSGGIAIATVDTSTADVIATVAATRSGGNVGLVVRYADANNYVYAIHNGTNAQLVKVVAGTPTTLVNTAATYSAGAEIRVICEGQKFRIYYNNVFIGTEQTIADAGLASGTRQGLYTSDTGNSLDDFRVYARGTGGEYAALDDF